MKNGRTIGGERARIAFAASGLLKTIKRRRLFFSVLAVFLGVMLVPIAVTGLGFQRYFSTVLYQHAVAENSNKLEGSKETMEENFQLLDQIALKIALSSDLTSYAIQKDALEATAQLNPFSGLTTYVESVVVYYGESDYLLTSSGMASTGTFLRDYEKADELYDAIVNAQGIVAINAEAFGRVRGRAHVLYIVPLSTWVQREDGVCVFLLKTDALQKKMQTTFFAPSDKMLIYNERGELILCSQSEDYAYFNGEGKALVSGGCPQEIEYGGTEYVCSQTQSSRGYTYIWLGDKALVFRDVRRVTAVFVGILLLALTIDLCFIAFTIRRGYQPVESMLELFCDAAPGHHEREEGGELATIRAAFERTYHANNEMRQNLQNSIPALREYFTLNAIQGTFHNREMFDDVCRGIDLSFEYPYFFVCCIYTGRSMAFGEFSPAQFSELMHRALPAEMQGVFHSGIEEGYSYGLLCVPQKEEQWLRAQVEAFVRRMGELVGRRLVVSYGPASRRIDKIGRSSLLARTAMDYRFILSRQTVISAADIDAYNEKESAYPHEAIQRFERSLEKWQVEEIFATLEALLETIRSGNYSIPQAKCICYDIVTVFVKAVDQRNMTEAMEQSRYFDLFSIAEFSTLDELIETIRLLGQHMAEFITVQLDEKRGGLSSEYIEYLYENIGNYQFSTEMMAEHFGITPQYLRRQFRKETGQPVGEYFNAIRLEKAKELLVSTNMAISDIVQRIGYVDVSSFIRKFKARFGVTPGKYREMYQSSGCACC